MRQGDIDAVNSMTGEQARAALDGTIGALKEALRHLFVEGKSPPYSVPYAIDGDLWEQKEVKSASAAYRTIDKAISNFLRAYSAPPE